MPEILIIHERCQSQIPSKYRTACLREPRGIEEALEELAPPVVVVPMVFSARSAEYQALQRQLEGRPGVTLAPPQEGSPLLAEAIADRVRPSLLDPPKECLVLIARGGGELAENREWLRSLEMLAVEVQRLLNLGLVKIATLRLDAPEQERIATLEKLRAMILRESKRFRILVYPMEFVPGGLEQTLPTLLHDLPCRLLSQPLLPHPALDRWAEDCAKRLGD